jgi:hypothetical protein
MKLSKELVLERLCVMSTEVMEKVYRYQIPADCFCGKQDFGDFQFDDEILEFIEKAVEDAIEKHKKEETETVK